MNYARINYREYQYLQERCDNIKRAIDEMTDDEKCSREGQIMINVLRELEIRKTNIYRRWLTGGY